MKKNIEYQTWVKSADCITHGGSHFLEVVIPFIKI